MGTGHGNKDYGGPASSGGGAVVSAPMPQSAAVSGIIHSTGGGPATKERHGAIVIPPEHLAGLPAAIDAVNAREQQVIAATRAPGFDAEAMIKAWEVMEKHH